MSAKYAFIFGEEGNYSVRNMCRWAKVSTSGYFHWKTRAPSWTALWRAELGELIAYLFADSDGTYGYRRIHAALARADRHADPHTVRSIMAERGLVACQPRTKGPRTTISSDAGAIPDLLRRDFTATEPGCKLVGDITYIRTWAGWVYLATVLDCATKKAVGYAMAEHMRTELIIEALDMAVRNGRTRPGVTIFHADRGTQGGFNRSSQHLEVVEVFDGSSAAGSGPGGSPEVEVARSSEVPARGRGRVLGRDRQGAVAHRSRGRDRCVAARGSAVVPQRWRHATVRPQVAPLGPLPVLR